MPLGAKEFQTIVKMAGELALVWGQAEVENLPE
jgi:hypothetical protein